MSLIIGTGQIDTIDGSQGDDEILGLAGNDVITGTGGNDSIFGDFDGSNMLQDVENASSFAQFEEDTAWDVQQESGGHTSMSQTVETIEGTSYELTFELATNYGAGALTGAVEVLWNGEVIDQFDTNSAVFSHHTVSFLGTGGSGELTIRSIDSVLDEPLNIDTSTPAYHYEKDILIGGEIITVDAFAEGQSNIYQVLNGTLHVFDPETEIYEQAGVDGTVVINCIGFNQEDDLIYGIAVDDGFDSLGNAVSKSDVVMMDATGQSYRVGEGPYRSWTGDFDDSGNLWAFHSSMDRISVIDVDQLDENGNPVSITYKFPKDLVTDKVWDLAYHEDTQTFVGAIRPDTEGEPGQIFMVDISGSEPTFSTLDITHTLIEGSLVGGAPAMTFGAAVIDGDGNIYVGGNGGDHDMDDETSTSGGIYRVHLDEAQGTAILELVTAAPKSYSNDGAIDPRSTDPFAEVDAYATVLIRSPSLIPAADDDTSYDDHLNGNAGQDQIEGGFGEDLVIGGSLGDTLYGNVDDDALYGGAGPDSTSTTQSFYDETGARYDQFGNLLPEDDDVIYGGDGDDYLSGSAGHDTLDGGTGADNLSGGTGNDILMGGSGDDVLDGGRENDALSGGDGADHLTGGSGNDILEGGEGDDILSSGSDDDVVRGGNGNDEIDGGSGNDWIEGEFGNDRIKAGSGDDVVNGGAGDDYINAYNGDDEIYGGDGRDKIYLGAGNDLVWGGAGSDTFVFRSEDLDGGTDVIEDFSRLDGEADRLDFRQLDLLGGGTTAEDWLLANVQQFDGYVGINLGGCNLNLTDEDAEGQSFFIDVCDGIWL